MHVCTLVLHIKTILAFILNMGNSQGKQQTTLKGKVKVHHSGSDHLNEVAKEPVTTNLKVNKRYKGQYNKKGKFHGHVSELFWCCIELIVCKSKK